MSLAQTPYTITAGTDTQVTLPGDVGSITGFLAYNTSPVDLIVRYNAVSRWLPVGVMDWFPVYGQLSGAIVFSTGQNPGLSGSPTTSVLLTIYTEHDGPPGSNYPLYVGRILNVGTTTVTSAQQLQGVSQTNAVTETDGANGPILAPLSNSQTLGLAARNNLGVAALVLEVLTTGINLKQKFLQMNSVTLATSGLTPSWGVGGIVAFAQSTAVAVTTQQTIVTYTTPTGPDSTYRINGHFILTNAVAPNAVGFKCSYTNSSGTAITLNLPVLGPAGISVANGVATFSNATFPLVTTTITAKSATAITVTYQDPTNTPNDVVTAFIEEVS